MSTYSSSSRGSVRAKRHSAANFQSLVPAPPSHGHNQHLPPAPPSASGQENMRPRSVNAPRDALGRPEKTAGAIAKAAAASRQQPRPSTQKESIMARNRHARAPTAVDPEDAVTVTVGLVGAKFKCLVEKEWPCESLIASAIAEYHLAYPTCEVPDCTTIFHVSRKEFIEAKDPVGKWCRDGDDVELGMRDRPMASADDQAPPPPDEGLNFHTYDFTVIFHRLPLGFTLKQEMDATVVANIYPKSIATHYERLVPGTIVVQMGDTPLESLGLRQVHEVIRQCKLPLPIRFRGWKKPTTRRSSSTGSDPRSVASPRVAPAPSSEPHNTNSQRRKSAPSGPASIHASVPGGRARASTETAAAAAAAAAVSAEVACASTAQLPSPYLQTRQKITTQRKKTNSTSPYPDHRSMAAERRLSKGGRASPVGELSMPLMDQLDTHTNQGNSPETSPTSVADLKLKQKEYHLHGMVEQFASTSIGETSLEADVGQCDVDSNQNEEESEEMLVEHIKILQAELTKKHEEAKLLANELEKYHARLNSVQKKREKPTKKPMIPAAPKSAPVHRASAPNLTLTPEVLEAIEAKQGLPAKGHYAGSNGSSMSGYSSYSNRSAMAKRHSQQLSRFVGKTGENSARCDASTSSFNSAYRRERSGSINIGDGGLKSPRRQAVQNLNNRYNYMPPKYSTNDKYYDAPSSFSTKGGLISRAKVTRDSYIKIPDTPGVGAYDVKLPQDKVRGGEIGDSDRSLPWP